MGILMNTYTGKKINPLAILEEDICIEDIAHALSLVCRGNGHIKYFYSVAQHCINCANEAAARGYEDREVLSCLLHDAAEAYISDLITPIKDQLQIYSEIEDKILQTIFSKYGIGDLLLSDRWKTIDKDLLSNEFRALFLGEEDRAYVPLLTKPRLEVTACKEIEEQFIQLFRKYFK